jgi:hypothetical protein
MKWFYRISISIVLIIFLIYMNYTISTLEHLIGLQLEHKQSMLDLSNLFHNQKIDSDAMSEIIKLITKTER